MRIRRNGLGLLAGATALAIVLAGCANGTNEEGAALSESGSSSQVETTEAAPPAATAAIFTAPTEATLKFGPATSVPKVDKLPALGEDPAAVLLEQAVTGGAILVYAKPGDEENAYAQYRTPDARYELGAVGGLPRGELGKDLLSATSLELFGLDVVRVNGVYGANAPVQSYFALDNGAIRPLLLVDTGHAEEIDLDGDGATEIVATHGTPMYTYVYRYQDGQFEIADVNEALGAQAVYWDETEGLFKVQMAFGETKSARYRYEQGKLEATA